MATLKQAALSTLWLPELCFYRSVWRAAGGFLAGRTKAVRSSKLSYDEKLAAELWDLSADFAKVPRSPTV